jgi:dTDP-4-amino-4,6-dideoxygalactose transaminase
MEKIKIPFLDLRSEYLFLKKEIDKALEEVLLSGRFILGPNVEAFEKEFASYIGCKYAIGVASGTDALVLALHCLNLPKGSEIILQSFTFIAVADSVVRNGLKPVFCDIDKRSYNLDVRKIRESISEKTKAIIVNHMYGLPSEIEEIIEIAESKGLWVIEDCSHAHGALYKNKKVGSFGHIACFSLYPAKILGAYGDGGIITTNIEEFNEKIRMLRNYGQKVKYYHEMVGYNSRLDEIQAAILRIKLKYLDDFIKARRKIAKIYREGLTNNVILQEEPDHVVHSYGYFVIATKKRDELQDYLNKKGIETIIHYPLPIHLQKSYKDFSTYNLPNAEEACKTVLSLPIHPFLKEEDVNYIINSITEYFKQ